ncbi:MAG: hypothetical protein GXY61_06385 [Lentisphaerae bacterium]|nr:hypothetical protein [Lentisphaerota bacterium]
MRKRDGFTLVEASVAMSIFVIGIAMILGGYMYLQKNSQEQLIQDELEMDLNMAVQRLQAEMRLSSLHEMTYYPRSSRRYTAVSFPLLDQDGEWDRTVIYHTYGEGDEQRLLRTEFDSFLPSVEDRTTQLETVVEAGEGGSDAKTTTLFQHILDWSIVPLGSSYDGYIDSTFEQRDRRAILGFGIVDPGDNTLTFTVTGKDDRSGGYKIGLDTLRASPSGLLREAEDQIKNDVGGALTKEYNASGLWSGYHQLSFDATAPGETFSVSFYNDRWEDTNFDLSGSTKSNVAVGLPDTDYVDLVLHLEGNTTNWTASAQTDDLVGSEPDAAITGAVRVILRGASMNGGGLLGHNGARCRVAFAAGDTNGLSIEEAYIDEVVEGFDVIPNTVGSPMPLTFNFGDAGCTIGAGETGWSDFLNFPIEYDKTYAVTLLLSGQPKVWVDQAGITGTYVLTNMLSSADLMATKWTGRVEALPATVAVEMLHTMYPSEGTYISPAIDTQMESLEYEISWQPDDSSVEIYVRSGSEPGISGAWSKVSQDQTNTSKRYVQYKAVLLSDGSYTPKLQDVALQWDGETKMVEVGGTFINGPNYGQFEVTVDGQPLTSPLRVSLVVRKEIRTMNNKTKTVEATEGFELAPRNTGK